MVTLHSQGAQRTAAAVTAAAGRRWAGALVVLVVAAPAAAPAVLAADVAGPWLAGHTGPVFVADAVAG